KAILRRQDSSPRWLRIISDLKLKAPAKRASSSFPTQRVNRNPTANESMKNQDQNPPKNHSSKSRTRKAKRLPDRQHVSAGVLFGKVAREQIKVEVDGAAKIKMTDWDAYIRQIYTMALNKNTSAARLLEHLRRQFPGDALPGDPITFLLWESDANL